MLDRNNNSNESWGSHVRSRNCGNMEARESIDKHQRNVGFILHTLVSEKHKINEMRSHKKIPRLVKPK